MKPCLPDNLSIKPALMDLLFSRYEIWPQNTFAIAQKHQQTSNKAKNLGNQTSK